MGPDTRECNILVLFVVLSGTKLRFYLQYHCCGVDGTSNYRQGSGVPWSCFYQTGGALDPVTGHQRQPSRSVVFEAGCLEVVTKLFRRHLLYCAFVTLCSALLQVK